MNLLGEDRNVLDVHSASCINPYLDFNTVQMLDSLQVAKLRVLPMYTFSSLLHLRRSPNFEAGELRSCKIHPDGVVHHKFGDLLICEDYSKAMLSHIACESLSMALYCVS